jgi:hypothetical protein
MALSAYLVVVFALNPHLQHLAFATEQLAEHLQPDQVLHWSVADLMLLLNLRFLIDKQSRSQSTHGT